MPFTLRPVLHVSRIYSRSGEKRGSGATARRPCAPPCATGYPRGSPMDSQQPLPTGDLWITNGADGSMASPCQRLRARRARAAGSSRCLRCGPRRSVPRPERHWPSIGPRVTASMPPARQSKPPWRATAQRRSLQTSSSQVSTALGEGAIALNRLARELIRRGQALSGGALIFREAILIRPWYIRE
jgi:hypothetical protein